MEEMIALKVVAIILPALLAARVIWRAYRRQDGEIRSLLHRVLKGDRDK